MAGMTLEDLGVRNVEEFIAGLIKLVGSEERLVRILSSERVLGEERLVRALIQKLGAERVQQMVQQLAHEQLLLLQDQVSKNDL